MSVIHSGKREEMGGTWGGLGQKLEKNSEVVEYRTHVVVFR